MKSLFLILIALVSCIPGGYYKVENFKEINDFYINRVMQAARNQFYADAMTNADLMTVEPIAIYSQVVAGMNYKVIIATQAYANTRNDIQIHEYKFYQPLKFDQNSVPELELVGQIKHFESNGISFNSPRFSQVNAAISQYLMKSSNKLHSVVDVKAIDAEGETFYVAKCEITGQNIQSGFVLTENHGEYKILTKLN